MSGEMRPGSIYSAPALGALLGVSPTPVREAMLDLTKEGLVEVVRNKGFRVVNLSESDLADLAELRYLLEVPTIRQDRQERHKGRPRETETLDGAASPNRAGG